MFTSAGYSYQAAALQRVIKGVRAFFKIGDKEKILSTGFDNLYFLADRHERAAKHIEGMLAR